MWSPLEMVKPMAGGGGGTVVISMTGFLVAFWSSWVHLNRACSHKEAGNSASDDTAIRGRQRDAHSTGAASLKYTQTKLDSKSPATNIISSMRVRSRSTNPGNPNSNPSSSHRTRILTWSANSETTGEAIFLISFTMEALRNEPKGKTWKAKGTWACHLITQSGLLEDSIGASR
uniref:Uncharacterized protein n=1 Tax=Oryza glumipatula TaxID=40148 RepID=A0A0D9YLL4_9ORYZ